ncbi:hypothetical protein H2203_004123 [Taxawa tesnikishii (nom. ined.)]|nr:hypothetical protein H2203_004123 [Dothideales sp. JES 119]
MASDRPHLSITLPRNFTFHYTDGEIPQTPAPITQQTEEMEQPQPAPPRQTFKVRRRKADNVDREQQSDVDSMALPSFEMTEPMDDPIPSSELPHLEGYLAPRPNYQTSLSAPKTPSTKLTTAFDSDIDNESEWAHVTNGRGIERPHTNSHPSYGGSCTSPESDAPDPFSYSELKVNQPIFSPMISGDSPAAKRVKTARHVRWTPEMDNHLWVTYMVVLQDPRVTPFKMLPSTAPPLGICHRVAREAKRNWKGHRTASLSVDELPTPAIRVQHASSPDTIHPGDGAGSDTPTAATNPKPLPAKWPRSEAATRKRLRELCKRKPSLSAHYQRLIQTRSPSPFQSSSPRSSSNDMPSSAFSSRTMNVALTAATAPSMQSDAPLAQLSSDAPTIEAPTPQAPTPQEQRPSEWFARIGRAQAHQKSRSLQLGLGLGSAHNDQSNILASPFDSGLPREDFLQSMNTTQTLGRNYINNRRASGPILNSPLELHAPIPTYRSLKRRYKQESSGGQPGQSGLEDVFTPLPSINNLRGRNRGFSLSAMGSGPPSLSVLFSPHQLPTHSSPLQ